MDTTSGFISVASQIARRQPAGAWREIAVTRQITKA